MEKDKEKKKSGLKERDKQIVVAVILLIILFFAYRFATVTMAEKIEEADTKIAKKTEKRDNLKEADSRRDEITRENELLELDSEEILKAYPERTSLEKVISYLVLLFDKYSFGVGNIVWEEEGAFYSFVDAKGKEDTKNGTITSTKLIFEFNCNYRVLRKLINFINNGCPTRLKINRIEVSYDDTVGGLMGEVEISVFTGYNITKYKEPEFNVDIGKDALFAN